MPGAISVERSAFLVVHCVRVILLTTGVAEVSKSIESIQKNNEYQRYPFARLIAIGAVGVSSMMLSAEAAAQSPAESAVQIYGEQIVVGGTNDPHAKSMPNLGGSLHLSESPDSTVSYAAQAGPLVGVQTYNVSVEQATGSVTERLHSDGERKTVTGFSQGGDAVGRAAANAYAAGTLDTERTKLILVGDPMNPGVPGGPRGIAYSLPSIPGFESMHVRGDTGATEIIEPCLQYDPICRFNPADPVNMVLGYIAHTGQGPYTNYNTVDTSKAVVETHGTVTSVTYLTPSPVEELMAANAPKPTTVSEVVSLETPAPAVELEVIPVAAAMEWVDTSASDATDTITSYASDIQVAIPAATPQIEQLAVQAHTAIAVAQQQATDFLSQFAPK